MSAKTRITIDRLDDGYLVTVADKNGERTAAAETGLGVIDRVFGWLGFKTSETIVMLDAVKKVMVEG